MATDPRTRPEKTGRARLSGTGHAQPEPEGAGGRATEEAISAEALLQLRRKQVANDPWSKVPDEDALEDNSWLQEALGSARYPLRSRRGRAEAHGPVKQKGSAATTKSAVHPAAVAKKPGVPSSLLGITPEEMERRVKRSSRWLDPMGDIPGFDNKDDWYDQVPVDVSEGWREVLEKKGLPRRDYDSMQAAMAVRHWWINLGPGEIAHTYGGPRLQLLHAQRTREESPDRTETRGESQWESKACSSGETVSGLPRTAQGPPAPEEGAGGEPTAKQRLSTPATEGRSQAGNEQTSPVKESAPAEEMEVETPREGQAQAEPEGENPGGD
ncbi:hypothetical protein KFL_013080010 [Klebsormidium nitens]|uniref:Uncharacterized protein n=1 Tax=Klebsormidium nitens TaxID=105231 RepID=A0A1Y1IQY5_KLENI|nr:hypothetical protein KFL_013080010 [Klebsormidium nitens]|eukprot:GAQ93114.1 hypothetical protein KFL_013080010 [Klebsormidium nitens]